MTLRRSVLWAATGLCVPIILLALYLGALEASGNFATVVEGAVYRSAQPTAERLAEYVRTYGIRTVLNLRGAAPGQAWYEAERKAARDLGVTLIDFPLSSTRELTEAQSATLVRLLKGAETPLLIHCRSGANRTGLAAATWLAFVAGTEPEVAARQLSFRYGHLVIPMRPETAAMDRSWDRLKRSLPSPVAVLR